ncbi:MAG: glycosyltransferase, partial [Pirellulales bacterium]|nr:glycosyltransferase [Pirellulales bacterium]
MPLLHYVLLAYAILAGLYWVLQAVGAWLVARRIPQLIEVEVAPPATWPRVSIVVAAANEAESIEGAAQTLLAQDYPDFEVILVDDRSQDATGQIVDRLAADDARVRPVHITELPEDWLGKVHALDCGFKLAQGDWVLFTDADVHLRPDTLRRAVAYGEANQLDHLALAPDFWSSHWLLDIMITTFLRGFLVAIRAWAVADPKSKAFAGVGAFNLVRRGALEKTPGFEWLRLEVADDMGLGMMLKQSGARTALLAATGVVGLYWYSTLGEMARGTEKGFASVARCSVLRMMRMAVLSVLLEGSPLVFLWPWGIPGLMAAGLGMIGLEMLSVLIIHQRFHRPLL